jgi:hypothetical protein
VLSKALAARGVLDSLLLQGFHQPMGVVSRTEQEDSLHFFTTAICSLTK